MAPSGAHAAVVESDGRSFGLPHGDVFHTTVTPLLDQSAFPVYPLKTPLMDPERLLVEHLPDVERTTAFVCRRHRLRDSDA